MEVAIYGGAFDPPTIAHEAIMQACLDRSDIDEVWVMPCGERSDKIDLQSDEARLTVLHVLRHAAFKDNQRLVVTDFEQRQPRLTQTNATVKALETHYPDRRFWFVYGSDCYHNMQSWEDGTLLRETLHMLLVARTGYELPEETERIRHLNVPHHILDTAISSTKVREALRDGQSVDAFVNRAVANWIRDHQAYHTAPTHLSS